MSTSKPVFFKLPEPFDRARIYAALVDAGFVKRKAKWYRERDKATFSESILRMFEAEHPTHVADVEKKMIDAIRKGHGVIEVRAESLPLTGIHVTVESRERTPADDAA
jgi:hypothetical protein